MAAAAAFVLRNVLCVVGDAGHAVLGDVVVGVDGHVASVDARGAAADRSALAATTVHTLDGLGQVLVVPGLANAYVEAAAGAADVEAHLRDVLHRSVAAGVTAVTLGGPAAADAALLTRLRAATAIELEAVPARPTRVVTSRDGPFPTALPRTCTPPLFLCACMRLLRLAGANAATPALGTGSLAANSGSMWAELGVYAALQRQRYGTPYASV
jgi:hypothetical protein